MEKSRAIELLEHLAWDRDIERNPYGDALNMAIKALKAQLSCEGITSDLISRQAAIDAINSWRGRFSEEYNEAIDDCENSIKELPIIQPEPQWIPVSERLPESGTCCLFTVFEHDSELEATTIETVYGCFHDYGERRYWSWEDEVGKCCIEGEEQLDGYHDEIIEKVLAWMPLPEAYKPNK